MLCIITSILNACIDVVLFCTCSYVFIFTIIISCIFAWTIEQQNLFQQYKSELDHVLIAAEDLDLVAVVGTGTLITVNDETVDKENFNGFHIFSINYVQEISLLISLDQSYLSSSKY